MTVNFTFQRFTVYCLHFKNQAPRDCRKSREVENPRCLKFSVKFPQSIMIRGAISSAGFNGGCWSMMRILQMLNISLL